MRTVDQDDRPVLDFCRCAMLPLRGTDIETAHADEIESESPQADAGSLASLFDGWDLGAYRAAVPGPHFDAIEDGHSWRVPGGEVVSGAPELARLSLNVAFAHHDEAVTGRGRRLVYGGHTIGIAAAQINRALPSLLTIVAWHSCDHLGPVFEGDTLHGEVELERTEPLPGGGGLVHLRSGVRAVRPDGDAEVLDWRLVGVLA